MFLLSEKGVINMEREKPKINSVAVHWSWPFQCELMVFNIDKYRSTDVNVFSVCYLCT